MNQKKIKRAWACFFLQFPVPHLPNHLPPLFPAAPNPAASPIVFCGLVAATNPVTAYSIPLLPCFVEGKHYLPTQFT